MRGCARLKRDGQNPLAQLEVLGVIVATKRTNAWIADREGEAARVGSVALGQR
jgi:hypothetical protein